MNKEKFFVISAAVLILLISSTFIQSIYRQKQAERLYKNIIAVINDKSLTKNQKNNVLNNYTDQINAVRSHRPILNVGFSASYAWFSNDLFGNNNLFVILPPDESQTANFESELTGKAEEIKCAEKLTRDGILTVCAAEGCYLDEDLEQVCSCVLDEADDCVEEDKQ